MWAKWYEIYVRYRRLETLRDNLVVFGLPVLNDEKKAGEYLQFIDDQAVKMGMFER